MSNCPRCQIVLGVKLSSWHGRCQIVLFCMMVSNCPRCQIVLGVKLSSLHGWCQIVLGVKLSSVSNCPITHFFTSVGLFVFLRYTLSILMTASMPWCLNSLFYIGSDWPFQKFIFLCLSFYAMSANIGKNHLQHSSLYDFMIASLMLSLIYSIGLIRKLSAKKAGSTENKLRDGTIGTVRGFKPSNKTKYATTCFCSEFWQLPLINS